MSGGTGSKFKRSRSCALDAMKSQAADTRQRLHEQGLGDSRDALQQSVAAAQQHGHHLLDRLALSDDHAAQLLAEMDCKLSRFFRHQLVSYNQRSLQTC